jgi:hypothetical protein
MTAEPLLELAARLLAKHRLDAVLIGNAAAALQGSPVTTVDLDFMFRKTTGKLTKLRRLADDLDAVVMHPFYPASELYRVIRDRDGLQFDFIAKSDGIRSFETLQSRASMAHFGGNDLRVASLEDIIRSKKAANRPQDRAVLPVLRKHTVKRSRERRTGNRSALRRESDRALIEQIRRLLALPMEKRTGFLRTRRSDGSSYA